MAAEGGGYGPVTFTVDLGAKPRPALSTPETQVGTDLRAVVADRAARPLVEAQFTGRDAGLLGDERHRLVWQLTTSTREPAPAVHRTSATGRTPTLSSPARPRSVPARQRATSNAQPAHQVPSTGPPPVIIQQHHHQRTCISKPANRHPTSPVATLEG